MEHCSYRHSDFYQLITLLMSSTESHLSNKPKQVFFNPINIFGTFTHSIYRLSKKKQQKQQNQQKQ